MVVLLIFGPMFILLGIAVLYKWDQLRKDPEALEATRLLEKKGYLNPLKTRYLFGAVFLIIAGVGMIVAFFVLRAIFE